MAGVGPAIGFEKGARRRRSDETHRDSAQRHDASSQPVDSENCAYVG